MKRAIAVVGVILVSPLLLIFLFAALVFVLMLLNILLNNANLRAFEKGFSSIDHPARTESLATASRTGNLGCASNHCDYFAGNLRAARLSRNELTVHYADMNIPPPPDPYFKEHTSVQLWFFDEEIFVCEPLVDTLFNEPTAWGVDLSGHAGKTLYIAYAQAAGAPPGFDPRCH